MLAYWRSLWNAVPSDSSLLELGSAKLVTKGGFNDGGTKLFIRSCYDQLAHVILGALAGGKNVVLSGTPGVGKTAFRNFLVFRLAQDMKKTRVPRTIVLHGSPGQRSKTYTMLSATGDDAKLRAVRCASSSMQFDREDPNLVYLVDVSDGNSSDLFSLPGGRTVMFTSPNERAYSDFVKENCFNDGPLYMPLWETNELVAAAQALGIDHKTEAFQSKVTRYGGVPRAVLEDRAYENMIEAALDKMEWNECTKNLHTANNTKSVRHRLFYHFVSDDFKKADLRFGTDYLLARAADKYVSEMKDAVQTVMASRWPGVTPGEKGDFLEAVVHRQLCLVPEVQLRRLDHQSTDLFKGKSPGRFPLRDDDSGVPLDWEWFSDTEQASQAIGVALSEKTSKYLRPRSDQFPAIDSILVLGARNTVLLIQVTINENHAIDGKDAKTTFSALVDACSGATVALVFVVAPSQFVTYRKQNLPSLDDSSPVLQYVLLPGSESDALEK